MKRTVVFRVSGTIILNSKLKISNPYITIAGQIAPGDGICIRKYPLEIGADEVIIRYLRVRLGGEKQQKGNTKFNFANINVVANYYKPGPATKPGEVSFRIVSPSTRDKAADYGKWYVADNVVVGNSTVTADNWSDGVQPKGGFSDINVLKLNQPWPAMPIKQQTAKQAYISVLESAGATLPKRDAIDTRIIEETRNGNATYEGSTYKDKNKVTDMLKIYE